MTARRKFRIEFAVPVPPEGAQLYTAMRQAVDDSTRCSNGRAWRDTNCAPFTDEAVIAPLRMAYIGDFRADDPIGQYLEHTLMDLARVSPAR